MKRKKGRFLPKNPARIAVSLEYEDLARIDAGPLKATGGKAKASWVRGLILEALDKFERGETSVQGRQLAEAMKEGRA